MKLIYAAVVLFLLAASLFGQEVKNTSYITATGEKVLRFELVVPAKRPEAWKLFSTAEGWKKWAAPVVSMDFRIGGLVLTNYDKNKTTSDPGTIRLPITNYLDGEMITLKVILNESFSKTVRDDDHNLQEIIQLNDAGNGKTRIVSSMLGWGKGAEWDKAYEFFARGNEWTFQKVAKVFQ